MAVTQHHTEWLRLVDISGPFLSLPVLNRVFPQQLDNAPPDLRQDVRLAFAEWQEEQQTSKPDWRLHDIWVRFVLGDILGLPGEALVDAAELPDALTVTLKEHGETLRPDLAIINPKDVAQPEQVRLLISVYTEGQDLNKAVSGRPWRASPATRMQALLHATDVPLGLVTNGEQWLLVHAPRTESSTFVTWYASLWGEEPLTLRAFVSLLGLRRWFGVVEADQLLALFAESVQHQQDITDQLGIQVRHAVEILIRSLDQVDKDRQRTLLQGIDEAELYEAAITVMMRLVFLLFAEERELLLCENPIYDQFYAISTLRAHLREQADRLGEETLERRHDAWSRLLATFRMVYGGAEHEDMRLPAYGGHLFDPDRYPFLEGRSAETSWHERVDAAPLPIHNRTVLHLLEALQVLTAPGGEARLLSFSALDVEQIGQVYESLLDHTAYRASAPLLGLTGTKGKEPEVLLADLEAQRARDDATLIASLRKKTGRSARALERALEQPEVDDMRLRAACDNDEVLFTRVRPFASLLRYDSNDYPVVITTGSVYVSDGQDRRSTGTHYTPPSLTQPLVQHALDPLVYAEMAKGVDPSPETLRSPQELLDLKICDPACGSGAFLVQACRYLADKLIVAWQLLEDAHPGQYVIEPEGTLSTVRPAGCVVPLGDEERRISAKRLIVDRCLYGVDKNNMAVEMAKLSLWLETLQKGKPFTFLDHAIRCGDSLVGVTDIAQVESFHPYPGPAQQLVMCQEDLAEALRKRQALEAIPDTDLHFVEDKARLLSEADASVHSVLLVADVLTGAMLATAGKSRKALDEHLAELALVDRDNWPDVAVKSLTSEGKLRRPFHWPLAFPEVFAGDRSGFDAIVSNPPFMGGQKITGALGTDYRNYAVAYIAGGVRGSADLCAYFFLRAGQLLRQDGMVAMLATNTIAQGDTREVGLDQLTVQGFSIPRAVPSRKWPGAANLEVAHLWLRRGEWEKVFVLDDRPSEGITTYLASPSALVGNPYRLVANADKSFQGSIVLGMGFVLTPEEAEVFLKQNPRNREALYPYLNGEDLNSRPDQSPSRWVINFHDWPLNREAEGSWEMAEPKMHQEWLREGMVPLDYPAPVAADYPELLKIVEEKVKPEREKLKNNPDGRRRKRLWWQYGRYTPALYATIEGMERVLVVPETTKYCNFSVCKTDIVYSHMTKVITLNNFEFFSLLCSNIHEIWARKYSSTLETRLKYTSSDCFETFPFPEFTDNLGSVGESYHIYRTSLMKTRHEGLTQTYNRFHNPEETHDDITKLRIFHVDIDQAVTTAYGWQDLSLNHGFHETPQGLRFAISEEARREVLDRLLALNFARYEGEVRQGLHDEKRKKGRNANTKSRGKRQVESQMTLALPNK